MSIDPREEISVRSRGAISHWSEVATSSPAQLGGSGTTDREMHPGGPGPCPSHKMLWSLRSNG